MPLLAWGAFGMRQQGLRFGSQPLGGADRNIGGAPEIIPCFECIDAEDSFAQFAVFVYSLVDHLRLAVHLEAVSRAKDVALAERIGGQGDPEVARRRIAKC